MKLMFILPVIVSFFYLFHWSQNSRVPVMIKKKRKIDDCFLVFLLVYLSTVSKRTMVIGKSDHLKEKSFFLINKNYVGSHESLCFRNMDLLFRRWGHWENNYWTVSLQFFLFHMNCCVLFVWPTDHPGGRLIFYVWEGGGRKAAESGHRF